MNEPTGRRPWKGLATDRQPVFIGYDQTERMVAALLDRASASRPDAVAAIARGGLVPGTMVSCMLALPLFILRWDRATGIAQWMGPAPDVRRILLVDDCCATGQTMSSVRATVLRLGHECVTLTVTHDPEVTCYVPDFSHPMTDLFRFPWERGEATPAARAHRARGLPAERTTEQPFFGLELDGVFPSFAALPAFAGDRAVVITSRPETDREQSRAWLARCGHGELPLECRPADVADDIVSVARFKAATATRWGCTHFVESSPEPAIRIAAEAPHLIVSWWSAADARAWLIGAAHHPPES